jgi:hypothetical protein
MLCGLCGVDKRSIQNSLVGNLSGGFVSLLYDAVATATTYRSIIQRMVVTRRHRHSRRLLTSHKDKY